MIHFKQNELFTFTLRTLIFALLIGIGDVFGISLTGQNKIRYGRKAKSPFGLTSDLYYLENYLELYGSYEDFRFHVRQRYLMPSEFGERLHGLAANFDKLYAEYSIEHLLIKSGDFYSEWGRGVLLGSIESLALNFDSGLEGVMVEADYENVEMSVFRGIEVDTTNTILESAAGVMLSYRIPREINIAELVTFNMPLDIRLGGSVIHFDEGNRHAAFDRRGVEGEFIHDIGSIYVTYSTDSYNALSGTYHHAFYSAIEFYQGDWSLVVDYKNYRFPLYSVPALQFPPQVFPQSIMYLFIRNQPSTHYQNDVGVQADLTYRWDDWDFNLNVNQSSWQEGVRTLPSKREGLYPFWSTFLTAELAPLGGDRLLLQGGYMENIALNYRYGGGVLYEWRIDHELSMIGEFQSDWLESITGWDEESSSSLWGGFREDYLVIALSKAHFGTITGTLGRSNDTWATEGAKPNGRLKNKIFGRGMYWPAMLVTADFLDKHQLRIFYGYERGGLGCAGGLCRFVPPFRGIKFTFTSQL